MNIDVPQHDMAFVHVFRGEMEVGAAERPTLLSTNTLGVLGEGMRIRLRARKARAAALVGAARPIGEPIVQGGPFVMNTEDEIRQAWDDYRQGVLDRT